MAQAVNGWYTIIGGYGIQFLGVCSDLARSVQAQRLKRKTAPGHRSATRHRSRSRGCPERSADNRKDQLPEQHRESLDLYKKNDYKVTTGTEKQHIELCNYCEYCEKVQSRHEKQSKPITFFYKMKICTGVKISHNNYYTRFIDNECE